MPHAIARCSEDARRLPRVLGALCVVVGLAVACTQSPPPASSAGGTPSATAVAYTDAATGITFQAAPGLFVRPATAMPDGTTSQATFTTYDPARTQVDMSQELAITASLTKRLPNEDLRAFAARSTQGASYTTTEYPRLGGIVIEGAFQSGRRKYVLVPRGAETVLMVDAFPTSSSRMSLFDSVLATLQVK